MRTVCLTDDERQQLERMARLDPKPYRRERAAAILKVAAGEVAYQVAQHGLLRPRDPDTVYGWLDRFEQDGIAGLTIAPGRGRKPAFFRGALAGP
jgi:transposase